MSFNGPPKIPSKEVHSVIIEEGKTVPTPEYWVARHELPFSKEFIGLQTEVAREVSDRLNVPMSKVVDYYTSIFHTYLWPDSDNYIPIDEMDNVQISSTVHEKEVSYSQEQPMTEYNDYDRFGCFSYFAHTGGTGEKLKGRIDIHFSNAEFDVTGPLDKEKIERRLHELKDMFTDIKKNFPEASFVRGDSWLYNIDAYTRLFPNEYVSQPMIDDSPEALTTGRVWGQFCDSHLELKKELGEQFLRNIRDLKRVTPVTVREALTYQALIVTAPIKAFYEWHP